MNSKEYWLNRENEARKYHIKGEARIRREMFGILDELNDSIQKEIDSFYRKYATKEGISLAEAKRRASKLDIERYQEKAKRYVATHDLSKQANEEMRLYNLTMRVNRLELLKANIGIEMVKSFESLTAYLEKTLIYRGLETYERLGGIFKVTIPKESSVKALVNASFKGATFSEDVWLYEAELKNKLSTLLAKGMIGGKNPNELAKELRKTFDVTKYESERLMRTELARVQTEAQINSINKAGFEKFQYIACGLPDCCPDCRRLNGKVEFLSKLQIGDNAPPLHPNCHCAIAPYESEDDYQKWLSDYKVEKSTKAILTKYLDKL